MKAFEISGVSCQSKRTTVRVVEIESGEVLLVKVVSEYVGTRSTHMAEVVDLKTIKFEDDIAVSDPADRVVIEAIESFLAGGEGKAQISDE
jgi:hypothetical protein